MTLIEVMACVLVIAFGLMAACAMVLYGLRLVAKAHGDSVGTATAMTVLADPSPLRTDPTLSPDSAVTQGYLNGLWVERRESGELPLDGAGGKLVSVTVKVDVYETAGGTPLVSVNRRLLRRKLP
jgi:hypothetical protein